MGHRSPVPVSGIERDSACHLWSYDNCDSIWVSRPIVGGHVYTV